MLSQLPQQQLLPEQKALLEDLIRLESRHDAFPYAKKGLEGMRTANKYLNEIGTYGLLVGGLAKGIWSGETLDELNSHKDVDVLILSPDLGKPYKFHRGIDWWIPQPESRGFYGRNGMDISLPFAVEVDYSILNYLPKGLVIPSSYMTIEMIVYGKLYHRDVDNLVLRALKIKLGEGLTKKPIDEVRAYPILDEEYFPLWRVNEAVNITERR